MGTRAAPAICHNFLYRLISDFMARENFEYSFFRVHIDDVVIAAPLDSLIEIIKKLRAEFKTFNILINEEKSVLTPQQKISFCGFCFDFVANRIALPKEAWPSFAQLQTQLTVKSFGVTEFFY